VHELSSSFVLAYHGCDRSTAEHLLKYQPFKASANEYDWLGSGVYFWESNPARGLEWARYLRKARKGKQKRIHEPYVVGAVIDLGYCLDLFSSTGIEFVKAAYMDFRIYVKRSGGEMPQNKGGADLLQRSLDCAVINHIHAVNKRDNKRSFDTVRGVFLEGKPIYETSGFYEKTHIQICVRTLGNIKAVFRVPSDQLEPF
jgi:hypothetical protein